MYERHTYKEMVYALPVKQGKVTLILKFAEVLEGRGRCTLKIREKECSISRSGIKWSERISMW